ncbi:MAG: pilus assembly protein PilF [Hydrogenophilales bacterium CG17_big_fil_post_rev_8_21_14_2_50_63_12]|nr:MAG: pilus assembly protein PilF [Hydrogenophilales bacterium CG17_big_fil_post_rev_8_21_14_2_50_63_12]PIX95702.1 MAG: pilus assembly protein PilF [Hydrogenophilales bacterium CG_4_10_14_3_um_filter_63_21]PJB05337.1 MAG: pilus assembly protein PilF [Hydrogenophilales bacterium CG_4_9_14_3_um_filter_63_34]
MPLGAGIAKIRAALIAQTDMNFDLFRFTLRAVIFDWLRQPERALNAYADAFRANPMDVRAARGIAWIHAQKQRWPAAAEWFDKALALQPGHADTWFNLAYVREQSGNLAAARDAFRRASELNPKHDRAWYGLGLAYAQQGEHAAAAEALQHAAELQPMNGIAWYALGMARHHNHQPEAVETVIRHLALNEPQTARRLILDAERADLADLVEMP